MSLEKTIRLKFWEERSTKHIMKKLFKAVLRCPRVEIKGPDFFR
jgi:hypothetical protein